METVSKTLHQLNVRQLKQLAKEFHVKTKSNRKSTLISNLLLQRGGYHRANRLPSITDDPNIRELVDEEDEEDEEDGIIEMDENPPPEDRNYLRIIDVENELERRYDILEYISGRLMRGEIDVNDGTFRKLRQIYLTGLDYQNDLRGQPDEALITEIEDFIVDTADDYQELKDRYYNR